VKEIERCTVKENKEDMKGREIHNTKGGKQNMACLHQ
jgi:hypothetical protein